MTLKLGGHRGLGCTDHNFYQDQRDTLNLPVENTVESIEAAFKGGADYIETDAVMSKDGILFTIHNVVPKDHFFGEMPQQNLNLLDYAEIEKYKTGRPQSGETGRMDTLLDLIAKIDPKTLPWAINIEIKGVQGSGQDYEDNNYLNNLADVVEKSGLPAERVLWSSFSLENIIRMSHKFPDSHYGMLFAEQGEEGGIYANLRDDRHYQYLQFNLASIDYVQNEWKAHAHPDAKLGFMHPEILTITDEVIDRMAEKNLGINCWALFEEFNETRAELYKKKIGYAEKKNVPFTVITDYLPEMKNLKL